MNPLHRDAPIRRPNRPRLALRKPGGLIRRGTAILALLLLSLLPIPPLFPMSPVPPCRLPPLAAARAEAGEVGLREILAGYAADGKNLIVREVRGRGEALLEIPSGEPGGALTFDGRRYRIVPIRPSGDVWALKDQEGGKKGRNVLEPLRDGTGRITAVLLGGRRYVRWTPEDGSRDNFRIRPLKSPGELREEALGAEMPAALSAGRRSDLVELTELIPNLALDIRYATSNNFMGFPLYPAPRAFLQRPAAEALARVQRRLAPMGLGLIIYDAYRPWYVTKMFWEATPQDQRDFVADPTKGSRHNRGCAVDLGLVDLRTGRPVPMPSGYDEFTVRAYPSWPGGSSEQRHNRELLRRTMEAEGFRIFHTEWWHYDLKGWQNYPVENRDFDAIPAR